MADDLLSAIRAEIDKRLQELAPLLDEYEELRVALAALASSAEPSVAVAPIAPARATASATSATAEKAARGSGRPRRPGRPLSRSRPQSRPRSRPRVSKTPTDRAILAALEHGSHTVAELLVVTGLPAREIRDRLRTLRIQRAIVTTDRESKTAYALPGAAELQ